jgi:hypothetical protein
VPSLRNTVIALVTSAGIVLALAAANAGVLTTWSTTPASSQPIPADHPVTGQPSVPVIPPLAAAPPAVADPPLAEPQTAQESTPGDPPATNAHPTPVKQQPPQQPTARPIEYRVPVGPQPSPVTHPPVAIAPAPSHQPGFEPPESPPPSRGTTSRTVNTEPCSCNGHMRTVHTRWDPPEY